MDKQTPNTTHLTDAQRIDWLRLIRSDRVGPHGIMAQMPQAFESVPLIQERDELCGKLREFQ
jgi:hypothetical protein